MQSILQILKLNDVKSGTSAKTGRAYELQDAECILLKEDGTPDSVGVLQVPRDLMGKVQVGTFTGHFALKPNFASRRIEAVLTALVPLPPGAFKAQAPAVKS